MVDAPDNRDADALPSTAERPGDPGRRGQRWRGWAKELVMTLAIAGLVLMVVGWLQRERQRGGGGALETQSAAPAFSVERLDGSRLGSDELRGKPLVLVFWATWCGVCQDEMPDLARFAAAADGRYHVLALSREPRPTLARWSARRGLAIPLAHDPGGRVSAAYRVASLPTHVIIDAAGRVVHDFSGAADPEILAEHMRRLTTPE